MADTYAEARDDLMGVIQPAWNTATTSAPLFFQSLDVKRRDQLQAASSGTDLYGITQVRWGGPESGMAALGSTAADGGIWRRDGQVFIQVFVRHGSGPAQLDAVADAMVQALEDPGGVSNIRISNVDRQDIGSDGAFEQSNVVADVQFDRVT